jgi:hypothetical protein
MERLKEIEAELSGIAPVLGKNGITVQPYSVPSGYFEHFAENLLQTIWRSEAENLLGEAGKGYAELPLTGNFTNESDHLRGPDRPDYVVASLHEEDPDSELASLSPSLAGLERKTPYQVPGDYFNEFRANTPSFPQPKAKLIHLHSRKRILKYAVAAAVTGVIVTAAFFTFHNTNGDPLNPLNSLANISNQEMANYLENHDVHWAPGTSAQTISAEFNDNDISDLLSNVSDSELEQYLPDLPVQKRISN